MEKLSQEQIDAEMGGLTEWSLNGDALQRTFRFEDFKGSMGFVKQVAALAERMGHHPDILVRYDKVTLTLTTHDAGGLTEKDFEFAKEAEKSLEVLKS